LTTFNVAGDQSYWILMNATDRIEIAPKHLW
jgi:hypothetical protein